MSKIVKRSIVIAGHYTSVTLEEPFWSALKEIARTRRTTLSEMVRLIDDTYNDGGASNLSSAIRLFVLDYYREIAAELADASARSVGASAHQVENKR